MIGPKSITVKLSTNRRERYIVQANKNFGICDIIKEVKNNEGKFVQVGRNTELLSKYSGRQINNPDIINSLENRLFNEQEILCN